ncbi:MAG: 6-carboxytetrahydropterin synthase [Bacteroidetes bacterium]|nr:6-carboxytetrahydropterin synthase [Bacteroidota bacterium]MBL6964424.1 6-carboxytetrahydropterin synthase [Bacteroidota bacterium]
MTSIRISKEFKFETSHILNDYDGLCCNIHGHSYRLLVTVSGTPIADPKDPKNGMVMDFGDLKSIVYHDIVAKYDHSLIVNDNSPEDVKEAMQKSTGRVLFTPYQPTCENMVAEFARIIRDQLPTHIKLCRVRLYETSTSYAEWFSTDNTHEN